MKHINKIEQHKKKIEHHKEQIAHLKEEHREHDKKHEKKEHEKHEKKHVASKYENKKGKVEKVMKEVSKSELHSSSKNGPIVKNKSQALAIALSEARKAGAHIPEKKKNK